MTVRRFMYHTGRRLVTLLGVSAVSATLHCPNSRFLESQAADGCTEYSVSKTEYYGVHMHVSLHSSSSLTLTLTTSTT
jgi:hypothetical protein